MSMVTELFGEEILSNTLEEVKAKIRMIPPTSRERRSYLLKDYAAIKGITLTQDDFRDVNA